MIYSWPFFLPFFEVVLFIVFNEAILSEHDFRVFTQLFKTPVADDAITVHRVEEAEEEARKLRTSGASPEPDFKFLAKWSP